MIRSTSLYEWRQYLGGGPVYGGGCTGPIGASCEYAGGAVGGG